ncbi:MAG: hypothetical protein JSU92_04735 [Deltaproteobacteria bacterium]|nr:MAG: hypothetical protein JSU92_04735 [Deltaproteobacteria bacterium]
MIEKVKSGEVKMTAKEFWEKYKGEIGLGILILYVILLALATIDDGMELGWFNWGWIP